MLRVLAAVCFLDRSSASDAAGANPVQKVVQMLSSLQQEIIAKGEKTQSLYNEVSSYCRRRSQELHADIKASKAQAKNLNAIIEKAADSSESISTKIEELSSSISTDEGDLTASAKLRARDASDFAAADADLVETIGTIERAIGILEKDAKKGASLVQARGAQNLAQALSAMVEAEALHGADAQRLAALAQSAQSTSDDDADADTAEDSEATAPQAAAYKGRHGGVIDTLEGLLEKAQEQLDELRKTEVQNKGNYEIFQQAVSDKKKTAEKEMEKAKKDNAEFGEKRATSESNLAVVQADISDDEKHLQDLQHECMTKATDFAEETRSRDEEIKALVTAKEALMSSTEGAERKTYQQLSFVQLRSRSGANAQAASSSSAGTVAIRDLRKLAWQHKSPEMLQLVSRLDATLRTASLHGADPFAKVKGLLEDMISKLSAEADSEAQQKAYCDKEMAETKAKKDGQTAEIEKLSTMIDMMNARIAKVTGDIAQLQKGVSSIIQAQATVDKIRQEEKALYLKTNDQLREGINGVQTALRVLHDYYGGQDQKHEASAGAAGGIITLLQVVESDFSKDLAEITAAEQAAAQAHEQETQDNAVSKAEKEKDIKYKVMISKRVSKQISEVSSDRENTASELDAVQDFWKELQAQCVGKADPYEERQARREAEIGGLREALRLMSEQTSLLQLRSEKRSLRGGGRR